jgi:hypothetical protein
LRVVSYRCNGIASGQIGKKVSDVGLIEFYVFFLRPLFKFQSGMKLVLLRVKRVLNVVIIKSRIFSNAISTA